MSAIVVLNAVEQEASPVPHKGDGSPYGYEMIFNDAHYRAYADTVTELCEALIDKYVDLDNDIDRAAARVEYAIGEQRRLQAGLNTLFEEAMAAATEAEQQVLLAPEDEVPEVGTWEADVPLVLVDTDYQPHGDLPRPVGRPRGGGADDSNLIWIQPASEAELIASLDAAGLISLGELLP